MKVIRKGESQETLFDFECPKCSALLEVDWDKDCYELLRCSTGREVICPCCGGRRIVADTEVKDLAAKRKERLKSV